jgi:hypothetical protein
MVRTFPWYLMRHCHYKYLRGACRHLPCERLCSQKSEALENFGLGCFPGLRARTFLGTEDRQPRGHRFGSGPSPWTACGVAVPHIPGTASLCQAGSSPQDAGHRGRACTALRQHGCTATGCSAGVAMTDRLTSYFHRKRYTTWRSHFLPPTVHP